MSFICLMHKEFSAFQKSFSTLLAFVVLDAVLIPQVQDQIDAVRIAFATLSALKWIWASGVDFEVVSQASWGGEHLIAQVTLVLALAGKMV